METMQDYLTAQYEDDKAPDVCPYCQQALGGCITCGESRGGYFHCDCQDKAIAEGKLKYSHGMFGTLVYSEWGSRD